MASETLDGLFKIILDMFRRLLVAEGEYKSLFDKNNKVIAKRENEAKKVFNTIQDIRSEIVVELDDWTKEQILKANGGIQWTPAQPLVFEIQASTSLNVVMDAFEARKQLHAGRLHVPEGQVYVFGNAGMGEGGYSEAYQGGETIVVKGVEKKYLVAVLPAAPGEINCLANQWLAGISVSRENVAKLSLKVPTILQDPLQVLKRSGGAWMSEDGRKNMQRELNGRIEHCLQELFTDQTKFWSGDKHATLDLVCSTLNQELKEWGLGIKLESISIIRQLPKTIYEIVAQTQVAEQYLLEGMAAGQRAKLCEESSLSEADMTFIESTGAHDQFGNGGALFKVVCDRINNSSDKAEALNTLCTWLRAHGGASLMNYINDTSRIIANAKETPREPGLNDVRLSQQVLFSAFRNPLIGLGEILDGKK